MQDLPRITNVRARAVDAPLAKPIITAKMTISSAPLLLIDVETDQGIVGRSYIFGYTKLTLRPMLTLVNELRDSLIGQSVSPVERMKGFCSQFRLLGRQGLLGMVLAGLDMAFWDVLGRQQNRPVAGLLGGETRPLDAYYSSGVIDLARDAKNLESALRSGFKAIKIRLGTGALQADIDSASEVRDLIGPEIRLLVDYNQSLTVPEAIRRIDALHRFDIHWIEEPVIAEDLKGHADVRKACATSIQTGENWWFPEDVARSIAAGASDRAMLDIVKIGGLTEWVRAAGMADSASLPVSSHLYIESSAHALAVTRSTEYLEYLDVAAAILAEPLTVVDGKVAARGPGFGMDWNEAAIERFAV